MSRTLNSSHDIEGSVRATRKSMAIYEKLAAQSLGDRQSQDGLAEAYSALGVSLARKGALPEALDLYRKNLALRLKLREGSKRVHEKRQLMLAYSHVGDTLGNPDQPNIGDAAGALDAFNHMTAIAEEMAAADSSDKNARFDLSMSYLRTGSAAAAAGQGDAALMHYRKSLAMTKELQAGDPGNGRLRVNVIYLKMRIGKQLAAAGDLAGSIRDYREAIGLGQEMLKKDAARADTRVSLLKMSRELVGVLAKAGDRPGALGVEASIVQLASGIKEGAPESAWVEIALAYYALGQLHEGWKEWVEARGWYRKSVDQWAVVQGRFTLSPAMAGQPGVAAEALARMEKK